METELICLDSSILIDFFRKKQKEKSVFFQLTREFQFFAVSVITEYEIKAGSTESQQIFWDNFFNRVVVLPYDSEVNHFAVSIFKVLKLKNQLIEIPDIFIAATAIKHNLKLVTTNRKHFERIEMLQLLSI